MLYGALESVTPGLWLVTEEIKFLFRTFTIPLLNEMSDLNSKQCSSVGMKSV